MVQNAMQNASVPTPVANARKMRKRTSAGPARRARPRAFQGSPRAQVSTPMQAPAQDDTEDKGLIGHNIVLARTHLGISQGELARRLGIDRRQLSEWERGVWEPTTRNLRRIGVALGRPVEWFLDPHDTP